MYTYGPVKFCQDIARVRRFNKGLVKDRDRGYRKRERWGTDIHRTVDFPEGRGRELQIDDPTFVIAVSPMARSFWFPTFLSFIP